MITYRFGKVFPITFTFVGITFIIVGFAAIENTYGLSLVLVFASIPMIFATHGVQIDFEKRVFREYSNYFGYNSGKWKSIDDFKYLSLLSFNEATLFQSRGSSSTFKEKIYHICLLSDNHLKRQTLLKSHDLNEINEKINFLSESLKIEIVTFSPKASSRRR